MEFRKKQLEFLFTFFINISEKVTFDKKQSAIQDNVPCNSAYSEEFSAILVYRTVRPKSCFLKDSRLP